MHPASLWKTLSGGDVGCRLCAHYCRIPEGRRGRCGVRENRGGVLWTLVYDRVAAMNLDPVEKKPLYHFMPGTWTFSFGTPGCDMGCAFCQNASLSQPPRRGLPVAGRALTPAALVDAAVANGAKSVSYTYSEPTIFFELMRDTAELAKSRGLANIMVSNGFMSRECLAELGPLIDAANIDLKAMRGAFYADVCQARLKPVLANLKAIRALGWWLEVTTLVIPGLNDSDEELGDLAAFLAGELGPETPWHVSRFHPDNEMLDRGVTPAATLERAYGIGRAAGLKYIYVGNVPGDRHNGTYCAQCGQRLIERRGFTVGRVDMSGGACRHCGTRLDGVGLP